MDNPANKIMSMTINGKPSTEYTALSPSSSAGLAAKAGAKLVLDITTKTLLGVTSIGLSSAANVIGTVNYKLLDTFEDPTDAQGEYVGDMKTVNAANVERIIITTNMATTDGQPPRDLRLILNGCFKEELLRTKAQVEEMPTTTKSSSSPVVSFY